MLITPRIYWTIHQDNIMILIHHCCGPQVLCFDNLSSFTTKDSYWSIVFRYWSMSFSWFWISLSWASRVSLESRESPLDSIISELSFILIYNNKHYHSLKIIKSKFFISSSEILTVKILSVINSKTNQSRWWIEMDLILLRFQQSNNRTSFSLCLSDSFFFNFYVCKSFRIHHTLTWLTFLSIIVVWSLRWI